MRARIARRSREMKRLLLSLCVLSASACARRPEPVRAPSAAPATPLSEREVTQLAVQHCASCHQGSVSREKPDALRVFDLDHAAWGAGLSAAQFSVFYQRMQGELQPVVRARLLAFTEREATLRAAR